MEVYSVGRIIRALEKDGWYEVRRNGTSHRQYKHLVKTGKVTVSVHKMSDDVYGKLLSSIEDQSGLDFSQIFGR